MFRHSNLNAGAEPNQPPAVQSLLRLIIDRLMSLLSTCKKEKADQALYLMQMSLNVTRKAADTLSWNGALNECERGFIWCH